MRGLLGIIGSVSLLCVFGSLFWFEVLEPLRQETRDAQAQYEVSQTQIARLMAELQTVPPGTGVEDLSEYVWPQADAAKLSLAVSARVMEIAEQSGFAIQSLQPDIGPAPAGVVKTHSFLLEARGGYSNLFVFISAIEQVSPPIAIATLDIRPDRSTAMVDDVPVYAQLALTALTVAEGR